MNKRNSAETIKIVITVFVLVASLVGCKEALPLSEITVSNECGLAIDVYMDGIYQFFLEHGFMKTIDEVEWTTHLLEARRNSTGQLVASEELTVRMNEDATWHVWSSAFIRITNNYGEKVSVYGDNVLTGELEDQESALMEHVPYGDRKLEARLSDGTVVDSITISVQEDIEYKWTVEK